MKKCKYSSALELAHSTLSQSSQSRTWGSRRSGLVLSCRRRSRLSGLFVRNSNIGVLGKISSRPFLGKSIRRWDLDWTGATFLYLATSRQSVIDLPTQLCVTLSIREFLSGSDMSLPRDSAAVDPFSQSVSLSACLSARVVCGIVLAKQVSALG